MAWTKPYTLDFGPTGDNVKQGVDKLEDNVDDIYTRLNSLKNVFYGSSAPVSPDTGQLWLDSTTTPARLKSYTGTAWILQAPLPEGYISGLEVSIAADTEHDITVAAGKARDSSDTYDMALASAMTKRIDATWAAGTNAGGLFDGSVAINTLYYIHLIRKDSDGSIDAGFDTSATAANIPAGYTAYKVLDYVLTDGSANIVLFDSIVRGNTVTKWWKARLSVVAGLAQTSYTAQSLSGIIPAGLNNVEALLTYNDTSTDPKSFWISQDGTNAKSIIYSPTSNNNAVGNSGELGSYAAGYNGFVPVVGNQIYYKVTSGGSATLYSLAVRFGR